MDNHEHFRKTIQFQLFCDKRTSPSTFATPTTRICLGFFTDKFHSRGNHFGFLYSEVAPWYCKHIILCLQTAMFSPGLLFPTTVMMSHNVMENNGRKMKSICVISGRHVGSKMQAYKDFMVIILNISMQLEMLKKKPLINRLFKMPTTWRSRTKEIHNVKSPWLFKQKPLKSYTSPLMISRLVQINFQRESASNNDLRDGNMTHLFIFFLQLFSDSSTYFCALHESITERRASKHSTLKTIISSQCTNCQKTGEDKAALRFLMVRQVQVLT